MDVRLAGEAVTRMHVRPAGGGRHLFECLSALEAVNAREHVE